MRVSLPTLRLLLGTLTFSLLTACGGGGGSSSSSSASEFDTLNLYFTENEIRSFNPNTGKSIPRADYDPGDHTLIPLNTDDDKQGYELVVYINDGTIKVMDYTDVENPTDIATFDVNDEVCIFPHVSAAQTSFEGDKEGERILLDQTSILVTQRVNETCSKERDTINQIDFTFTSKNNTINNITITEVNSSHLFGDTLLDFTHTPTTITEEDKVGRYGFLGYDNTGEQLHFYSSEGTTIWETALPNTSPVDAIPTIQQVTDKEALIQQDGDLYLKDIAQLFDAANTDSDTTPNIPIESKVAELFEDTLALELTDTEQDIIQIASNGTIFALIDDDAVYLKKQDQTELQLVLSKNNNVQQVEEIQMTDNGTLLVLKTLITGAQTLVRINIDSFAADTIVDGAEKVTIHTQNNNIYINTLTDSGWQAEWLDENFERTTFEKTIFVFAQNSRFASSEKDILLISPDKRFTQVETVDTVEVETIIIPKLYEFDASNKVTGRKRQDSKDFVFGEFSVDVQEVIESEVVNDAFGRLELKSVRDNNEVTETYFFKPSEEDSHEEGTANKALLLIPAEI